MFRVFCWWVWFFWVCSVLAVLLQLCVFLEVDAGVAGGVPGDGGGEGSAALVADDAENDSVAPGVAGEADVVVVFAVVGLVWVWV